MIFNRIACAGVWALVCSAPARAQSPDLLEAARLHRADAREKAENEFQACAAAHCPAAATLALLSGVLALSDGEAASAAERLDAAPPPSGLEAHHAFYRGEAALSLIHI